MAGTVKFRNDRLVQKSSLSGSSWRYRFDTVESTASNERRAEVFGTPGGF
jgi:hypothetical protein